MKLIKNIYLTVLILLCICSCAEKELVGDIPVSSAGVAVSLKVSGNNRAISRTTDKTATSGESTIGNVYLLFYEQDADIFAEPIIFIKRDDLKNVESWNDNIELTGLFKGTPYDVYAFANLPNSSSANLSEHSTKGTVLELSETLDKARNDQGTDISFSAASSYMGGDKTLSIDVIRTVARIESKIDLSNLETSWEIETVNILNERNKVSYQENSEPMDVSRISSFNAFLSGNDSLYYYTYENPADSTNENNLLKLKINLRKKDDHSTKRTYTALVAKKYNGELKRNTIYRSKIILSEKNPVVIELSNPSEWVDRNVNVTIPSVYMDFPTDSIILSERGLLTYNFKSNADSIHIRWKNMPNLSIPPLWATGEGYIYPKDTSGIYELDLFMSAFDENEEKGTITFTAGNLAKTVGIRRPGAEGKSSFTVTPSSEAIRTYDYATESGEKITMKFEGLSGMNAWFKVRKVRFVNSETGKITDIPIDNTDQTSGGIDFTSDTEEFSIGEDFLKPQRKGTTHYRIELGMADKRYGPTVMVFYFNIKRDK